MLKHSFLRTTYPIELKFHMKTSYDRLAKIDANCSGHMTKMTYMPIYGKKHTLNRVLGNAESGVFLRQLLVLYAYFSCWGF